jgi:quercetin dioxygenase-like cupin family protein
VSQVVRLAEAERHELAPGISMQPLFGEGAMLNLLEFEPRATVPPHSHPHEQLGLVIDGVLVLEIDGVEHRLGSGDAYQIPGGIEHAAWTQEEGCRVLDVFQPVREDYLERVSRNER